MNERHYWSVRLVKDGPDVGVMTFFDGPLVDGVILDRSPRWQALVGGEVSGRAITQGDHLPVEVDGAFLRNIKPTTKANYEYLVEHAAYSTAHAPTNPDAAPKEAVDFMKLTPF